MTLLSDYRRIKDGSARCSLRIREHILQQAPKVTHPDAYMAGVYEGLLDQALLMVDRLTGIDPEPVVDEIDEKISALEDSICKWTIILNEKHSDNMVYHRATIRAILTDLASSSAPVNPLVGQVTDEGVRP